MCVCVCVCVCGKNICYISLSHNLYYNDTDAVFSSDKTTTLAFLLLKLGITEDGQLNPQMNIGLVPPNRVTADADEVDGEEIEDWYYQVGARDFELFQSTTYESKFISQSAKKSSFVE